MAHDALGAHARDELGISLANRPRPVQAALASALSFSAGAALPLLVATLTHAPTLIPALGGSSLFFLACLGAWAAQAGGAPIAAGALRVLVWGVIAMGVTTAIGRLLGTVG